MDLRRLEVFVKVAELGGFSRAAEALGLTQPTVSEHVRALEADLGVQLLDRLGRGAVTTPAGELLLGYARQVLALVAEARQAVDLFQGRMRGTLAVGGSTIPGEYVLPPLIGRFRAKYSEVTVCLRIGSSRQVCAWVDEGLVEVGLVGAPPAGRTLVGRALMDDEMVVVVGPEHPWAGQPEVSLDELVAESLVVRERGSGSREALEQALASLGRDLGAFRVVAEMGSTQAVKRAVRAGLGVAVVSRRAVEDECRAGLLSCVTVRDLRVSRSFYLVVHRDRSRSPLAQAFLAFLESESAPSPS
jgi:DNA-binding transcriptional LysR family regulator